MKIFKSIHSDRVKRRHDRPSSRFRARYIDPYRFEIVVFLLLATGVFLLVEKMQIKVTVWRGLMWVLRWGLRLVRKAMAVVVDFVHQVETSDLVGILLIAVAMGLVLRRMRFRWAARYPVLASCPVCGGDVVRRRRSWQQRFWGMVLRAEIKPYGCTKCDYRSTGVTLNASGQ